MRDENDKKVDRYDISEAQPPNRPIEQYTYEDSKRPRMIYKSSPGGDYQHIPIMLNDKEFVKGRRSG